MAALKATHSKSAKMVKYPRAGEVSEVADSNNIAMEEDQVTAEGQILGETQREAPDISDGQGDPDQETRSETRGTCNK
ncbi:hypothetical protein Aduo_001452 [Ancylostoma duodenale]